MKRDLEGPLFLIRKSLWDLITSIGEGKTSTSIEFVGEQIEILLGFFIIELLLCLISVNRVRSDRDQ